MTRLRPLGGGQEENYDKNFLWSTQTKEKVLKIKITNSNIISQHFAFVFWAACVIFVTWAHSTNRWHHPVSSLRPRGKFQNSEISHTFLHCCLSKVMFYATKVNLPSTDTLITLISVSKVIILVNIFTFVNSVSFQDGGHKQNDRLHPFWYTVDLLSTKKSNLMITFGYNPLIYLVLVAVNEP